MDEIISKFASYKWMIGKGDKLKKKQKKRWEHHENGIQKSSSWRLSG
jgi:hypothetical protein